MAPLVEEVKIRRKIRLRSTTTRHWLISTSYAPQRVRFNKTLETSATLPPIKHRRWRSRVMFLFPCCFTRLPVRLHRAVFSEYISGKSIFGWERARGAEVEVEHAKDALKGTINVGVERILIRNCCWK